MFFDHFLHVAGIVFKTLVVLALLAVLLVICFFALLGYAGWLAIAAGILLVAGFICYVCFWDFNRKPYRYACMLPLFISLLCGALLYFGTAPRPLYWQERTDILHYLELRYPDQTFQIVSGNAKHRSGGWGILGYGAFRWNEIEAVAADSGGVRFPVSGGDYNGVLVGRYYFTDDYTLAPPQITEQQIRELEDEVREIILAHSQLFGADNIGCQDIIISYFARHVNAQLYVNLNVPQSAFDENAETEKLQIMRAAIIEATGLESVALNTRFYFAQEP